MASPPPLSTTQTDESIHLVAAGNWTAAHAPELAGLIAVQVPTDKDRDLTIDLGPVDRFDSYVAWLLRRLAVA